MQQISSDIKGNKRRIKLHVLPTEEHKSALLSTKTRKPEVFLECYHETATFALLAHGCWLRSRQALTTTGSLSAHVWVWQQESQCHSSDEISLYDEFPPTTSEEEIKRCIASRLPQSFTADQSTLLQLCPRFLARFVTVRCHLPGTGPAVWIDRSFFDESGAQTYDVCTVLHDEHDVLGRWSEVTAAPTKIMEYLRRFQPVLFEQVTRCNRALAPHQDLIAMTAELPASAFGEDELPRPTAAQLSQVRDPREAVWRARCEEHDRKLDQILDEHLERLCESPAYRGKWVVLTEESCPVPLHAANTKLEALKWKASTWAELKLQGTPAFIFLAAVKEQN